MTPADPQAARAAELFRQGISRNSICVMVYGAKTPRTLRMVNDALTAAGRIASEGDA